MKKLETKLIRNKKKKKNQILIGIAMIVLLVLSIAAAGLSLFNEPNNKQATKKITINGFKFEKQGNYWITAIEEQKHIFFYLPTELENISINITNDITTYINQPLYIVNENTARAQINFNLFDTNYVLRTPNACIVEEECIGDLPTKNCSTDNIIIYKESNITKVYQEENCIYITGEPVQGTDKFLQKILQIT